MHGCLDRSRNYFLNFELNKDFTCIIIIIGVVLNLQTAQMTLTTCMNLEDFGMIMNLHRCSLYHGDGEQVLKVVVSSS